ncbi:MAG: NAD(P)H-dependent oxidoreductase [Acidimicrobiia bacterium]
MSRVNGTVSVLAVAGSLRRGSHNRAVLEAAAQIAPAGVEVTIFDRLEAVPVFNEDLENAPDDQSGVLKLRHAMAAADGLLISTPEYNQSVPGVLKNMIDWLSRGAPDEGLRGKPVAVAGATTGPWGTRISQTVLRQMLHSTQALVLPAPTLYIAQVGLLLDDDGRLVDQETLDRLGDLMSSFAAWIRLVRSGR